MTDPTISQDARKTDERAGQATDRAELERQIMDPNVPKNEREWWAAREIAHLRTPASGEAGEMVERLRRYADPQDLKVGPLMIKDALTEAADLITRLSTDTEAMRLLREARDCIEGEFGAIKLVQRIDAALGDDVG